MTTFVVCPRCAHETPVPLALPKSGINPPYAVCQHCFAPLILRSLESEGDGSRISPPNDAGAHAFPARPGSHSFFAMFLQSVKHSWRQVFLVSAVGRIPGFPLELAQVRCQIVHSKFPMPLEGFRGLWPRSNAISIFVADLVRWFPLHALRASLMPCLASQSSSRGRIWVSFVAVEAAVLVIHSPLDTFATWRLSGAWDSSPGELFKKLVAEGGISRVFAGLGAGLAARFVYSGTLGVLSRFPRRSKTRKRLVLAQAAVVATSVVLAFPLSTIRRMQILDGGSAWSVARELGPRQLCCGLSYALLREALVFSAKLVFG